MYLPLSIALAWTARNVRRRVGTLHSARPNLILTAVGVATALLLRTILLNILP